MIERTTPATAVLDSEAVSAISQPTRRSASVKRAQAVLEVIDHLLNRLAVIDTGRSVAAEAGDLLHRRRLGSEHAVDAFVAATAREIRPSIILTSDEEDLSRLCAGYNAVAVQALP